MSNGKILDSLNTLLQIAGTRNLMSGAYMLQSVGSHKIININIMSQSKTALNS